MPTQFQVQPSYIPKSSTLGKSAPRLGSILTIFAGIVFVLMLASGVALYILTDYTINQIKSSANNLAKNQENLNLNLARDLLDLDRRIVAADMLLERHVVISPLFEALQDITLKTVRFKELTYSLREGKYELSGNGNALSYSSIALQSDEFAKEGNRDRIANPVFSGLGLDQAGNVTFDFNAEVIPALIDYKELFDKKTN